MSNTKASFDCTSCGLCCHTGWEVEVGFYDDVPQHLVKQSTESLIDIMKTRKGMCIAFRGRVKVKCSCSIYERRPKECREFEPGNAECIRLRRQNGLKVDGED